MPLPLGEAVRILEGLANKPKHVARVGDRLMAWIFEPTNDPNMEYEIVLEYDGIKLTVRKVCFVQIEPPAMSDITDLWMQNPTVTGVVRIVTNALEVR